jgi:molybdate transport system substrate-binding protein
VVGFVLFKPLRPKALRPMPLLARRAGLAVTLACLTFLTVSCGPSASSSETERSGGSLSGSVTVSAAASLQGVFIEIKTAFVNTYPDVDVTLNFGASSTLAQQIIDAAPVDVFASADEANMAKVAAAGLLSRLPTTFATNSLEIIVRRGNPSKIAELGDLSQSGLVYITCAPEVPIGAYGAQVLRKAGVTVNPASLEPDVKSIVAKVSSGEADAGIVYATDITATKSAASGVAIPTEFNVTANYPIAPISSSRRTAQAQAWIDFVTGPEGQGILRANGFGTP